MAVKIFNNKTWGSLDPNLLDKLVRLKVFNEFLHAPSVTKCIKEFANLVVTTVTLVDTWVITPINAQINSKGWEEEGRTRTRTSPNI